MIIDFHTHIFPSAIRKNRENYFPTEPEFKLLYGSPQSKMVGAKALISAMDDQGVDISVIFGFPWKNSALVKKHNDYIMDSVAKYPGRFMGFCCLDPLNEEAAPEAERCIESGLSGIGELASYESGLNQDYLDRIDPLMALCRKKDLPALIHTNEPMGHEYPGKSPMSLSQIYSLIKKYPKNKMVLAHWGGGIFFFNLLKKEVSESFENIYFDTAASPFLYDTSIYPIAIRIIGLDKILFGSDFPLLSPERYFTEMTEAGLSENELHHITGLNAAGLLKL